MLKSRVKLLVRDKHSRDLQVKHLLADLVFGIPEEALESDDADVRWAARRLFLESSSWLPPQTKRPTPTVRRLVQDANLTQAAVTTEPGSVESAVAHESLTAERAQRYKDEIRKWSRRKRTPLTTPGSRASHPKNPEEKAVPRFRVLDHAGPARPRKNRPSLRLPLDENAISFAGKFTLTLKPDFPGDARAVLEEFETAFRSPELFQSLKDALRGTALHDKLEAIRFSAVALPGPFLGATRSQPQSHIPKSHVQRAVERSFRHVQQNKRYTLRTIQGHWVVKIPDFYGPGVTGRFLARETQSTAAIEDTGITFTRF